MQAVWTDSSCSSDQLELTQEIKNIMTVGITCQCNLSTWMMFWKWLNNVD